MPYEICNSQASLVSNLAPELWYCFVYEGYTDVLTVVVMLCYVMLNIWETIALVT
jgi:hypothetical protein